MYKSVYLALLTRTCYQLLPMNSIQAATNLPWMNQHIVRWTRRMLESYRHWIGAELIEREGDPAFQARALFELPQVVISHGMQTDPILNYGNRTALELWELTWEQLVQTPSRLTAEAVNRAERERMLEQASERGYIDTYRGVRITRSGRRFLVENAVIWNVLDSSGERIGQAATFTHWKWLP